ncbi:MAG TPA: hypothetical protein VL022_04605 [Moheibacter sp.]|nr:hypothetical protein [Moheibacter sp.]
MKQILITISLIISSISFAQSLSVVKRTSPVFPGCENTIEKDRKDCFFEKLNQEISLEMKNYQTELEALSIASASAKVKLNILKSGSFEKYSILNSSSSDYSIYLKKALDKIAQRIGPVVPAKTEKGEASHSTLIMDVLYQKEK